uniref:Transposase Tc1-like domain-containing protein n=1 Tax=Maylandia zebra TaxID=106582 RepID=A0A3P9CYM3_9CICH
MMRQEMSQNLRKEIISLHRKREGYKISKALHIIQNTVAKRRPGHPRKLTSQQECLLMRRVEEYRHASSLQLAKAVESQTGVTVSRDTIQRTLQRNGMRGYRPQRKPLLKPMHKKAHLEFARAHVEKDEDYWDSILWSDETKITVFGTNEKCMMPTVKHGCCLLHGSFWFSWVSFLLLYFFKSSKCVHCINKM